jgi:hypothetical protein
MEALKIPELNLVLEIDEDFKEHVRRFASIAYSRWVLEGRLAQRELNCCNQFRTSYDKAEPAELLGMFSTLQEWDEEIRYRDENFEDLRLIISKGIIDYIRLKTASEQSSDQFAKKNAKIIYNNHDWDIFDVVCHLVDYMGETDTTEAFAIGNEIAAKEIDQERLESEIRFEKSRKNLELANELEKKYFKEFLQTKYEWANRKPLVEHTSTILKLLSKEERLALAEHGLPNAKFSTNIRRDFQTWMKKGKLRKKDYCS